MFTSGTTGMPKGAMSTHGQTLRVFEVWTDALGLREGDRYLIVNPFFHSFGYKAGWISSIMRGRDDRPRCRCSTYRRCSRTCERERITVLPGPPTLLQGILDHPDRDRYDLSSLRLTVTGAASVPVELIRRLRDEMTFETIVTGYGLTETSGRRRHLPPRRRPRDDRQLVAAGRYPTPRWRSSTTTATSCPAESPVRWWSAATT